MLFCDKGPLWPSSRESLCPTASHIPNIGIVSCHVHACVAEWWYRERTTIHKRMTSIRTAYRHFATSFHYIIHPFFVSFDFPIFSIILYLSQSQKKQKLSMYFRVTLQGFVAFLKFSNPSFTAKNKLVRGKLVFTSRASPTLYPTTFAPPPRRRHPLQQVASRCIPYRQFFFVSSFAVVLTFSPSLFLSLPWRFAFYPREYIIARARGSDYQRSRITAE